MSRTPKAGRDAYFAATNEMIAALHDSGYHISQTMIVTNQHHDSDSYFAYINIKMGELTEERYDQLRALVNSLGGSVNIPSFERGIDEVNVRIWMKPLAPRT